MLPMDPFNQHWLSQQELPISAIVTFFTSVSFVLLVFRYVVLNDDNERPISFSVPSPKQCSSDWEGEELEEPSVKVTQIVQRFPWSPKC